jgi:glycosyltransferase involved in cell wall biosynthesis
VNPIEPCVAPSPGACDTHRIIDGPDKAHAPVVAIYRTALMNYNEVYIRTDAEALQRYRSVYVGVRRLGEVDLPNERTIALRETFRSVDHILDPVVTRVGWRLERAKPFARVGRWLSEGSLVGRARQYAFQVHGYSPTLYRKLRALDTTVLHAYTGVSGAHALPLARKLRIPLVVTFNGYDSTATDDDMRKQPQAGRIFLRRRESMMREVQQIIAVAEFIRRRLVERGWPPEKMTVVHSGIDTELFTTDGAPPPATRAPIVFFAGRLIEKKGVTYLLQAMHDVQRRVPDAELVIAGAGALMSPLQAQAADLGVRARFLGRATPAEIREWLARARVYCMPSVTAATGDSEGVPTAMLEAMSCGLPVVASTSAGIPEAVIDGETGFLVAERDAETLGARLAELLSNPIRCETMGAAARDTIRKRFNLQTQAAKIESIYDRARIGYADAGTRR